MNEEKKQEFECSNCSWNGTELSKKCNGKPHGEDETCSGCSYLDDKCPVCGDEVGKPGIREEIRLKKEAEEKAKKADIQGGAYI